MKLVYILGILLPFISEIRGQDSLASFGLEVDRYGMFVAGFSSGGYMAQQLYMTYSELFRGMGCLDGGPFLCTPATGNRSACLFNPELTDMDELYRLARHLAKQELTARPINREGDRIYLWHGFNDDFVPPLHNKNSHEFYATYAAPRAAIWIDDTTPSGHAYSSIDVGNACDEFSPTYVRMCGVSTAMRMFNWFFGMNPGNNEDLATNPAGYVAALQEFDQTEFTTEFGDIYTGMDSVGFVYIPPGCEAVGVNCKLMIYLHGCTTGKEYVGKDFILDSGMLPRMELYKVVGLFPQIIRDEAQTLNQFGCWDFSGYTEDEFYTRNCIQIRILRNMVVKFGGIKESSLCLFD